MIESDPDLDDDQMAIIYLDCYPVHTGDSFRTYIWDEHPYIILCFVPANCELSCNIEPSYLSNLTYPGTGKAQPADVGLNRVIKHRLKQAQMNYLVDSHQKQIASGLSPDQVKFTTSLPALHDASVARLVKVYDFMTGPIGHCYFQLVLCPNAHLPCIFVRRRGRIAPQMGGTFPGTVLPARKHSQPSMITFAATPTCTMRSRSAPALFTASRSKYLWIQSATMMWMSLPVQ